MEVINKIVGSYLFISLIFAIMLSLAGVSSQMFGDYFRSFLSTTSYDLNKLSFNIPDIPHIRNELLFLPLQSVNWWTAILNFFVNFANIMIKFLNFVIDILNFLVMVINNIIKLVMFIVILIRNIFTMRDSIVSNT